jgi:hypothetical protein
VAAFKKSGAKFCLAGPVVLKPAPPKSIKFLLLFVHQVALSFLTIEQGRALFREGPYSFSEIGAAPQLLLRVAFP